MKQIVSITFIFLFSIQMNAQIKILGEYDHIHKVFQQDSNKYWIDFFQNGIARLSRDGFIGLVDSTGAIICRPKYDKISDFQGEVARVCLNLKFVSK